jgi:hypothetical protein
VKNKLILKSNPLSLALIIVSISILLLTSFRNPDLIHDTFFISHGIAIKSGLYLYRDIYSVYGPITSWIFAVLVPIFGDYVYLGRILYLLVNLVIVIAMYFILKNRVTKSTILLITLTYILGNSGIVEVNSPRWPFALGIWPTSLSVLQILLIILTITWIYEDSDKQRWNHDSISLYVVGIVIGILTFSRLQSLGISFLYTLVLGYLTFERSESKRKIQLLFSGLFTGFIVPLIALAKMQSIKPFIDQFIFGNFRFAKVHNDGNFFISSPWLKSLIVSAIFGISAFSILMIFAWIMRRIPLTRSLLVTGVVGITLGIVVIRAGNFQLPEDFNRNIKYWIIKWAYQLPGGLSWFFLTVFLVTIFKVLSMAFRRRLKQEQDIRIRQSLVFSIIGLASLTLLYVNFAYLYFLIPIMVGTTVLLVQIMKFTQIASIEDIFKRFLALYLAITLVIGVSASGGDYKPFRTKEFFLLTHSSDFNYNLDNIWLDLKKEILFSNSSFYFCDYTFLRLINIDSFKVDKDFYAQRPKNVDDYLRRLDNKTNVIVSCNKETDIILESQLTDWISRKYFIDNENYLMIFKKL